MKKTQRTDIFRLIISRKAAFLTLCLIIALGLCVFLSTRESEKSMKQAAQEFFREQQWWDLQVISSMGAGQEDVDVIRDLPGVTDAEGMWNIDGTILQEDTGLEVNILSMTDRISRPVLLSGTLPSASDECALEPDLLEECGVQIGDTLTIAPADDPAPFPAGTYRITGTVYHPNYIQYDTSDVVVVSSAAFMEDRFDRIAVIADGTQDADPFSDVYFDRVQTARRAIEAKTDDLTAGLPEEMRSDLRWIVLDRKANVGYVSFSSTADAYSGAGLVFGGLFLLVIALECFACVAVIVEEEKRIIGVKKAFGFRASEILIKYVAFGVAAALTGSVLGITLSYFMSSYILQINDRILFFIISATKPKIMPVLTGAVCLGIVGLCALTAVLSCLKLLKSPADLLLKGVDLGSPGSLAGKSSRYRFGLYFRMILRNITSDFSRVALSIAVVVVSCVLIGGGITVKLGFDGANQRQLSDIMLYDVRVGIDENTGDEVRDALEKKLNDLGVEWCAVRWENRLFDNAGIWDSTMVICSDDDKLPQMIGLIDPETGEKKVLGDQGALIQCRMAENLNLSSGDTLTMIDGKFMESTLPVAGSTINYTSRMVVMNRKVYDTAFGTGLSDNGYLVLLGGMKDEDFRNEMLSVSDDLVFERGDAFYEDYKSVAVTYSAIMLVISSCAVLISIVILINLANIYVARKKRELVILRLNGFSLWMCKAYVACDALLVTGIGLFLGVIIGIPVARMSVHIMEREYLQFVREVQPLAWIFAVAIEAVFSLVIYGFAMRRIRHYEIGDLGDTSY
ncbi:MAG: ABC transporter permease [Lachnospiraceae bacterium]|nr:ABC transporter permease [Lachnospiraceae bacterium]